MINHILQQENPLAALTDELLMMKSEMIFDKGGNEIIAMIIPRMTAQGERLMGALAGGFKLMRQQLIMQEFVAQALINQDALRKWPSSLLH